MYCPILSLTLIGLPEQAKQHRFRCLVLSIFMWTGRSARSWDWRLALSTPVIQSLRRRPQQLQLSAYDLGLSMVFRSPKQTYIALTPSYDTSFVIDVCSHPFPAIPIPSYFCRVTIGEVHAHVLSRVLFWFIWSFIHSYINFDIVSIKNSAGKRDAGLFLANVQHAAVGFSWSLEAR